MMSKFEILCVTMHQRDFSKIQQMNIHSDVFFANQADRTCLEELNFDGHHARMLTTDTRGVGINRNMCLQYAKGEICLFADDDVAYSDDMEEKVLAEFDAHPDADVMIFHFDSDSERKQVKYAQTKRCYLFDRMAWGTVRIAFRLSAVRKANLWFTTLFGGGAMFPAGEDSMWLAAARNAGLTMYVSKETIGKISYKESTWFTGFDEKYFFGQGAYYQATRPGTVWIWALYSIARTRCKGNLSAAEKMKWFQRGREGYRNMRAFDTYKR